MKRLLLLLPFLLAATPVRAQVDPDVHKLCSKVNDYAGCVQTNSASTQLNKKAISIETKIWEEVYLEDDPDMAEWAINNPEEAAIMKEQWQYAESVKKRPFIDNISDCAIASRTWNDVEDRCEKTEETGASIQDNIQYGGALDSKCPLGERSYKIMGMINGQEVCLSAYQAEILRSQKQLDIQNNIQQIQQ